MWTEGPYLLANPTGILWKIASFVDRIPSRILLAGSGRRPAALATSKAITSLTSKARDASFVISPRPPVCSFLHRASLPVVSNVRQICRDRIDYHLPRFSSKGKFILDVSQFQRGCELQAPTSSGKGILLPRRWSSNHMLEKFKLGTNQSQPKRQSPGFPLILRVSLRISRAFLNETLAQLQWNFQATRTQGVPCRSRQEHPTSNLHVPDVCGKSHELGISQPIRGSHEKLVVWFSILARMVNAGFYTSQVVEDFSINSITI